MLVQNVGHTRAPAFAPDGFEGIHDARCHEGAFLAWDMCQWIESDGEIDIRWVEVHHVIRAVRGNEFEEFLREIAMRINECDAAALLDVLGDQVLEQSRFSRTRLSNDVGMKTRILRVQEEWDFSAPCGARSEMDGMLKSHDARASPDSSATNPPGVE
jgi:hypothetical protein